MRQTRSGTKTTLSSFPHLYWPALTDGVRLLELAEVIDSTQRKAGYFQAKPSAPSVVKGPMPNYTRRGDLIVARSTEATRSRSTPPRQANPRRCDFLNRRILRIKSSRTSISRSWRFLSRGRRSGGSRFSTTRIARGTPTSTQRRSQHSRRSRDQEVTVGLGPRNAGHRWPRPSAKARRCVKDW